jgi:UDP-N-acetylmuramate dehydrogenase
MQMLENVSLAQHSTMRLGGVARFLCDITDADQIPEALTWARKQKLPVIMIGDGSNIVWSDKGYDGLVLVNKIKGFTIAEHDRDEVYVRVGAGENWDSVVERTVAEGLHGIEALSLIPGTAGATPVQNVGAYGQDVSQTLVSIEAYDAKLKTRITIPAEDCNFTYRDSRFKSKDRGRFFITSLIFSLQKANPTGPYYGAVQTYLAEHGITEVTPETLRQAVVTIRQSKLPDPAKVANNGSFFGNPIISKQLFGNIIEKHPDIAHWALPDGTFKLSAAWLIEKVGYKNFHDRHTGMATWHKQPLVLVNENAENTNDLIIFRNRIIKDVEHTFGVTLVQEPELI